MSDRLRQKVAREIGEIFADSVDQLWDAFSEKTGSPIEAGFLVSLIGVMWNRMWDFGILAPDSKAVEAAASRSIRENFVAILPQANVGRYRVDFCIFFSAVGGSQETFIVECDGHDFHDRTHEQASRDRERDRYLQTQGYRVFRFTGTDIHRRPIECASEVASYIDSRRRSMSCQ